MGFTDFNSYEKDTVILNSDRVVLNSKDDSVFILSKKTVGVSATDSVHFDIGPRGSKDGKYIFIVNSPAVQLGLPENGINEPIAKADSTIAFLRKMVDAINEFNDSLTTAVALGVGTSALPDISIAAAKLRGQLILYKETDLGEKSPIKSKISKTI
jgi:hypothetical protein